MLQNVPRDHGVVGTLVGIELGYRRARHQRARARGRLGVRATSVVTPSLELGDQAAVTRPHFEHPGTGSAAA